MVYETTITTLWLINGILFFQASNLADSLIFTFMSLMAFTLSTALLVGTIYWYNQANKSNEKLAEILEENKRLRANSRNKTLRNFVNQQMVELSDIMNDRFTLDEVEQMLFDIDVDDKWEGSKLKSAKIRNVLEHLKNRNKLYLVDSWIEAKRPDIYEEE